HHNAIQIAADSGIAIKLRNVINPDHQGTLIGEGPFRDQRKMIKGITLRPEVVQCEISGIGDQQLSEWLNELSKSELQPVLQFQLQGLETSSFVFEKHGLVKSQLKVLESGPGIGKKEFRYRDDLSLVSITGDEMANSPGVFGKMFEILGRNGINVISMAKGGGNQTLTALIPAKDSNKALNALHEGFFLSGHQVIHLFLAGTGLIGSTLLRQIKKQKFHLLQNRQLELRVVGLSNSRKMQFDLKGIDIEDWQLALDHSAEKADAKHFVDHMKSANLRNCIFVDCTPNSDFSSLYRDCLLSNISISTPNKLVASGPASTYRELKQIAQLQGVRFAFETNVGAGLPVINTLNDLLQSGDQILQIEGVLSGSLSYIFNQFQQGGTFSDAVQAARDAGLTEPDPRDDLFGKDFCRKLVILAREAGWKAELANVDMKPFLSKECLHSQSVEEFMQSLVQMNETMDKLRTGAAEQNKIIRIVGKVTPQHASLALEAVAASHPFYGLSGSDNMIVFTTERYQERPLVIRGPGAGAEVTAAGVFAEIISIANVL
ncbi:MAG: ACT domain-containing protein, partial [Saprospiraceae bacterium]